MTDGWVCAAVGVTMLVQAAWLARALWSSQAPG
jgi:hypothetical protein